MVFDTPRYSQRLQQIGVPREQAEAHAELARDMIIASLATKADLSALRAELQSDLKLLEQRMIVKLGAMIAAGIAVFVAAQRLL
jgi:hypothetical protein